MLVGTSKLIRDVVECVYGRMGCYLSSLAIVTLRPSISGSVVLYHVYSGWSVSTPSHNHDNLHFSHSMIVRL